MYFISLSSAACLSYSSNSVLRIGIFSLASPTNCTSCLIFLTARIPSGPICLKSIRTLPSSSIVLYWPISANASSASSRNTAPAVISALDAISSSFSRTALAISGFWRFSHPILAAVSSL